VTGNGNTVAAVAVDFSGIQQFIVVQLPTRHGAGTGSRAERLSSKIRCASSA